MKFDSTGLLNFAHNFPASPSQNEIQSTVVCLDESKIFLNQNLINLFRYDELNLGTGFWLKNDIFVFSEDFTIRGFGRDNKGKIE